MREQSLVDKYYKENKELKTKLSKLQKRYSYLVRKIRNLKKEITGGKEVSNHQSKSENKEARDFRLQNGRTSWNRRGNQE